MDSIQKFCSDIDKIKKHERSENPSSYDALKVSAKIKSLFERNFPAMKSLSSSYGDYWEEHYIKSSADISNEPTKVSIDRLVAMFSLLEGSTEFTECLADSDWKELCSLTNLEAEELPIDTLNDLMMIFVDKKAL